MTAADGAAAPLATGGTGFGASAQAERAAAARIAGTYGTEQRIATTITGRTWLQRVVLGSKHRHDDHVVEPAVDIGRAPEPPLQLEAGLLVDVLGPRVVGQDR